MVDGGTNLGTAYGYIEVSDNIEAAVQNAQGAFRGAVNRMAGQMQALGDEVAKVGGQITLLMAPIALAMGRGVSQALTFEQQLFNIGSLMGATEEEVRALGDELLAIGGTTRAGPQAVADAFAEIVGGVADATTHMSILEASILTAEAGGAELVSTTAALVGIMNSYGYSAEQAAMVSDVLTQTVGMGVGSMEEFAAALPSVTGLAAANGVELDNLAASLAFLTTKGTTASQAATQLQAIMSAMLNPNEKLKAAFAELGWESGAAALEMYGLAGVTGRLENAFGADALAPMLGSVEALNGALALNGEGFEEFIGNFEDTRAGASEAARAIQKMSAQAKLDVLRSQVDVLGITVGNALLPVLSEVVDAIMPVVESITTWINENPELTQQIVMLVGAFALLGPILLAVGTAISAIGALLAMIVSPVGIAIAAIAALGVAYANNFGGIQEILGFAGKAFGNFQDIVNEGGSVTDGIISTTAGVVGNLAVALGLVDGDGFLELRNSIETNLNQVVTYLETTVGQAIEDFKTTLNQIWTDVQPGLERLRAWFVDEALPGAVDFIQTTVIPAIDGFISVLVSIWDMVYPNLLQLYNWFTLDGLPAITAFIEDHVRPAIDGFIDGLMEMWTRVEPGLTLLFQWFRETGLPAIETFITTVVLPTLGTLIDIISGIWEAVAPALGDLFTWFVTNGLPVIEGAIQTAVNVIGGIEAALSAIWTNVQGPLNSLKDGIASIFNWIKDNIIQPLINIIGGIPKAVNDAIAAITGLNNMEIDGANMFSSNNQGGMSVPSFTTPGGSPGFAMGGYTGDGPVNEVAGVVHRGEYVVPQRGALVIRGDNSGQKAGPTFMPGAVVVHAGTYEEGAAAANGFMDELDAQLRAAEG